ncbi:hypothetical protein HK405_006912, partial [Cladochytrium tenue]
MASASEQQPHVAAPAASEDAIQASSSEPLVVSFAAPAPKAATAADTKKGDKGDKGDAKEKETSKVNM